MLQGFLQAFHENWAQKRVTTAVTITLHFVAVFIVAVLIEALFWIGLVSFIFATPIVIGASLKIPMLVWFWGFDRSDEGTQSPEANKPIVKTNDETPVARASSTPSKDANTSTLADQEDTALPSNVTGDFEPIRQHPVGTRIVSHSEQEVVVVIKSAVRFWCWFAPGAFFTLAVVAIPIGGWLGFLIYEASLHQSWQFNPRRATDFGINGAIFLPTACLGAAAWSYFAFRPWVKVTVNANEIRFGDKLFDRRWFGGFRIGYKTSEADLRSSIISDRFGVTLLRLSYGPWGEDLKYLVDSYYASAIVIWLNDIIGSVGENDVAKYDPNAGRKIELL